MKLEYYFSVTSPFCYIGNQRIFDIERQYNIKWELKPYAIETSSGTPLFDPNEMRYLKKDIQLLAEYYKLPLVLPKKQPKDRLPLECFFIANDAGKGKEYIVDVTNAYWAKGKDIGEIDLLAKIAKSIGIDETDFRKKSSDQNLKERLKKSTEEGNSSGVFGVPTLLIEDEIFWGQDRIDFAKMKLEKTIK